MHVLGNTVGRTIPYPKIFLKWPKHKPGMYSMKEWCDHRKMKIVAMRELSVLVLEYKLFQADKDVNWAQWKEFKVDYNINKASMRSLVKEHASVFKPEGNKRTKKPKQIPRR